MVFKSTADKLQRATEDLAATESAIAELQAEREALLEDSEPEAFAKLDNRIADREKQAQVFRARIPLLQAKLADEGRAAARAKREEAVAQAERVLPIRMMIVEAISKWAKDGIPLVEKLQAASKLKGWPDDLPRPYLEHLSNAKFLAAIGRALSGFGAAEWSPEVATEIVADAVAIQREGHAQAIDELRLAPQPEPDEVAA